MKRIPFLILFIFYTVTSISQTNPSFHSGELLQSLKKLNTVGSVLYIAAHPDDENTRLLTWLSKEKKLRTGYLSLTRGDGGQNLVGKEQGELLGLIRTQELLAARKIDGAEQFFTRANDFGFSKNPEETFKIWNKDSILSDVVWVIRRFKPDVIICRFPTTGEGGHGHHTASAILAVEAFEAAADPKRFPGQLAYTETWQAKRVFWNSFIRDNTIITPDLLKIDVGIYNPLLGKSYGEMAAESRSMHKSQGFGSAKSRGSNLEYFKQLKGEPVKDVFEGIDLTWKRTGNTAIQKLINDAISRFNAEAPEKIIPELIVLHKHLQELNSNDAYVMYLKQQKLKETESLLLACSGLWLEAAAADPTGIPGKEINMSVQVIMRNNSEAKLNKIFWPGGSDTIPSLVLKQNELYTIKHKEALPAGTPFSNPYWLNAAHSTGLYTVTDQQLIGKPENDPAANVVFDLLIAGHPLKIKRELVYKHTDPVKGEIYRPFEILPPATVTLSEKMYVFSGTTKNITFTIKANAKNTSGSLIVTVPKGWTVLLKDSTFSLSGKDDEKIIEAIVNPGKSNGKISAALKIDNNIFTKSISRVEYDHIPTQFMLTEAEAGLVNVDLVKSSGNIGYIIGAGDDVPACLKQIGYNVTILTDELLGNEDLSKYQAIVTGVRAHNTNERLQVHYNKLMEYVKNGGNLIVQYNTNNRIGPLVAKIGPYPFTISRNRVTDEHAEVRFVNAKHPVLNFPNKITPADFEGWKQERGIYFATELDKNYETVLSMNDPDEKPHEGSLIIARHGKGNFVYTGLVFFRELPAGVPGAYRLFANLLSLPQHK